MIVFLALVRISYCISGGNLSEAVRIVVIERKLRGSETRCKEMIPIKKADYKKTTKPVLLVFTLSWLLIRRLIRAIKGGAEFAVKKIFNTESRSRKKMTTINSHSPTQ